VTNFRALVEHVAKLAYVNPDELLFFRGQDKDYQSKAGGTTLYPSIYRGDPLAQLRSTDPMGYVYVFGPPYLTNRISINSEHDIVNVRLLSICPPSALRPCFQEGYLAGTADVTTDFDSKTELDFRNRLIAKFGISRARTFWGSGFDPIPESALYPRRLDIGTVSSVASRAFY
jgi:hypothetical protein